MHKILSKFINNPINFIKSAFSKLVSGPLRYGKKGDYDASRYWSERFTRHGNSLRGVGDEGLSEEENKRMYEDAGRIFRETIKANVITFNNCRILEVGCGNGFYTRILKELGAGDYTGFDITDELFAQHKKEFPGFQFVRGDISADPITGPYDLIIMIDVIEHIVKESKLNTAMKNIANALADNGLFLVAPVMKKSKKHLFHVRFWTSEDIKRNFQGYRFNDPILFRNSLLLAIRKIEGMPNLQKTAES